MSGNRLLDKEIQRQLHLALPITARCCLSIRPDNIRDKQQRAVRY